MDKIAEALIKLIETGGPIAKDAAWWYFTIRMLDMLLGNAALLLLMGTITYAAVNALGRWKDFADSRREYWKKNPY